MVRPLPPDWWPFATDEERAEGWGDPKFDRRKKGSPNDRRSTSPAAPHDDDVSERVAAILFGAVDDERFDMVMAALSPAAPRPEDPQPARCVCGASPPRRPWTDGAGDDPCRDGNGNFREGHRYVDLPVDPARCPRCGRVGSHDHDLSQPGAPVVDPLRFTPPVEPLREAAHAYRSMHKATCDCPAAQALDAALASPAAPRPEGLRPNERVAVEAILNRVNADPDDDAAIVARAALRLAAPRPEGLDDATCVQTGESWCSKHGRTFIEDQPRCRAFPKETPVEKQHADPA